ncbi:MAG: trimethylamine methyltransferase family protein, partial [Anaerovorax sp.]
MGSKGKNRVSILDTIHSANLKSNKLSDEQLYAIHAASLEVLAQVGIKVESKKARDLYESAGAYIDGETVKIPAHIVEDCIKSAPSVVLLAGRNVKNDYVIKQKKVAFINFGEGVNVIDPYTKEYRPSVKSDLERNTLVVDAINVLPVAYRSVASQDKPGHVQALHNAEAMFNNTTKHIFIGPDGEKNAEKIIEMAGAIVGGKEKLKQRPIVTFNVCPTSPLQL